jgi:hypothetical protein
MNKKRIYPALLCLSTVILLSGCGDLNPPDKKTEELRPQSVHDRETFVREAKWLAAHEVTDDVPSDCGYAKLSDVDGEVYGEDKAGIDCCVATMLVQGFHFYATYDVYSENPETERAVTYLRNGLGYRHYTWDSSEAKPYGGYSCDDIETREDVCSVPSDELHTCVNQEKYSGEDEYEI